MHSAFTACAKYNTEALASLLFLKKGAKALEVHAIC